MAKEYMVSSPDELRALGAHIKDGNVDNVAKVWSAGKRAGGLSPWDGKIYVAFESYGKGRKRAMVYRISLDGEKRIVAQLKYTPALAWCNEHLTPID